MKRRKLNVSKLLTLGLLLSYSANIAANTTSETMPKTEHTHPLRTLNPPTIIAK